MSAGLAVRSARALRVQVVGRGGPEVLRPVEGPPPVPGRGQVRIAVRFAGVAYGDLMRRRGLLAPPFISFVPGYDVAGVVDAAGPGLEGNVGRRVVALMPWTGFGGYASHVLLAPAQLVDVPEGLGLDHALGVGLNYVTARQVIHRLLALPPGASLLMHGAAGGLGTAVLDVARLHGLRVLGTASAGKHDAVRVRGGTPVDYRSQDFVAEAHAWCPGGVDAVIDPIGGEHLRPSAAALRPGGTLVNLGVSGDVERGALGVVRGVWTALGLWARSGRRVRTFAIGLPPASSPAKVREDWSVLLAQCAAGAIEPELADRLPLDQAAEAHRLLEARAVVGKLLLSCGGAA